MRHALFVALLALLAGSLSLTAEARWHHRHHHPHRHYRHVGHPRHHPHYRHVRRTARHLRLHPHASGRPLHPASSIPVTRPGRALQAPRQAPGARPGAQQQSAAPVIAPRAAAALPAAPAAQGRAKAAAPATQARRIPDWKYPPPTIKPVPGGKQHVLAPDTDSFVIIPGYRIVK